jgi:hypothetical protein
MTVRGLSKYGRSDRGSVESGPLGKAGPGGAVTPSEALDTEVQAPCPQEA